MIAGIASPPALLTTAARWARARQAAVVGALLTVAVVVDPDRPLAFDICLWRRLTGHPCLTCGLTRSVCHAIRGEWSASLALHPAGILVVAALAGWGVWSALEAWRGESIRADLASLAAASALRAGLAVSALVWLVRLVSGSSV